MKTKVAEILSKMTQNLPEMAFLFFSTRLVLLGASIGDSIVCVSLVAYIGYRQFINKKKAEYTDEMSLKMAELEKMMGALKVGKVLERGPAHEQKQAPAKRYF